MEIQSYLSKRKVLENNFLDFIDSEDDIDEKYLQLINYIKENDIENNFYEFQNFIYLIFNISNNYHRKTDFFQKIERILLQFKESLKQTFSHYKDSKILQLNRRIIVFLCKESIITLDDALYNELSKKQKVDFEDYFNEFEPPNQEKLQENKSFKERRNTGENDDYLAQLIRIDSIDEFIPYVTRLNISLDSQIKESIFETNQFLIENKNTTLIEYAAFFGSIQIFQYLRLNDVELTPSLWLYAIHGRNPELIHLLEENNVKPEDKSFRECLIFSIKCHHNELSNYIKDSLMDLNENEGNDYILSACLENYNYNSIPEVFDINSLLYNACKFNYFNIVDILLRNQDIYVNIQISYDGIQKKIFLINQFLILLVLLYAFLCCY